MKARTQPDSSRYGHLRTPAQRPFERQDGLVISEELARVLHYVVGMEPTEISRLEKTLVVAACFPFLMMGLLFLFA
jgi:hypothetical protein